MELRENFGYCRKYQFCMLEEVDAFVLFQNTFLVFHTEHGPYRTLPYCIVRMYVRMSVRTYVISNYVHTYVRTHVRAYGRAYVRNVLKVKESRKLLFLSVSSISHFSLCERFTKIILTRE